MENEIFKSYISDSLLAGFCLCNGMKFHGLQITSKNQMLFVFLNNPDTEDIIRRYLFDPKEEYKKSAMGGSKKLMNILKYYAGNGNK